MNGYVIEKKTGKVSMNSFTLFVKNIDDMEELEFWENRLDYLKQPYIIAYRKIKGRIFYSIFTNTRKKGSAFK